MMEKNIYKWGMIGCGSVTEVKSAPAYQKTDGFELCAVMSRNRDKAERYAERHNIPLVFDDADALINHPDIDAVYIATPPDSHEYYALKVADAGKICCIEKPMAPTYEACIRINSAFQDKNLPLFVAYYRRSLPRFLKVKEWIDTGEIGKIRHIQWQFAKPANNLDLSGEYNWRTDKTIAKGGYFDDLASHGLDLFSFLVGTYTEAAGSGKNQYGWYRAYDQVKANWKHVSGVTGYGSWDFGAEQRTDVVKIYGNKGNITFSVFGEMPILLENDKRSERLTIPHPENVQLCHVQNMMRHLRGKTVHPSQGDSAAHTAWVMDGILEKKIEVINNKYE